MKNNKKIKSTVQEFVDSLPTKERKEFDKEYKDLLLSELLISIMKKDEISVRKLAELSDISPTVVQAMRSGIKKDFSMQSFFKILNGLGCKIVVEKNGHQIPLSLDNYSKK